MILHTKPQEFVSKITFSEKTRKWKYFVSSSSIGTRNVCIENHIHFSSVPPQCRDLLQPDLLEDVIVSVCLKQHGLESALELLGCSTSGGSGGEETAEEHSSLLDAVFTRINGLERRIQVCIIILCSNDIMYACRSTVYTLI